MDLAGPQLRLKPISPLSARLGFLRPHSFFPPPLPPLSLPHPAQPLPLGTGVGDQPTGPGLREGAGSGQGRILIEAKEVASSWELPGGGGHPQQRHTEASLLSSAHSLLLSSPGTKNKPLALCLVLQPLCSSTPTVHSYSAGTHQLPGFCVDSSLCLERFSPFMITTLISPRPSPRRLY